MKIWQDPQNSWSAPLEEKQRKLHQQLESPSSQSSPLPLTPANLQAPYDGQLLPASTTGKKVAQIMQGFKVWAFENLHVVVLIAIKNQES
jgi:hypothetical protein